MYTGRAQDLNPNSPTYINGPFGDVPVFFKSSILTSDAQANAIAASKLIFFSGRASQITMLGPANPAHDEEDVAHIRRAVDGIDSLYTLDKIVFALAAAGVNATNGKNTGQQTCPWRKIVTGS